MRATIKKGILAVMGDPKYRATELFIGKYTAKMMPMKSASNMSIIVCIIVSLNSPHRLIV